jgi:threonylcarbamoyladenosine tRNA methylthiotransferase MtaB
LKAVVFNLGCKVNQYESDVISEKLRDKGYDVSNNLEKADLYIINTCAVTNEAERKSRQAVSRCQKFNPNAKILVCGCACEKNASSFAKNNVLYISGVANKLDIINHIDDQLNSINVAEVSAIYEEINLTKANRTRAYVKIQDGCNNFCSYCIIPYLRGRSRSRDIGDIVREVETLALSTKEIVLTGINLKQFGEDTNTNLTNLILALQHIDVRIRLGSFYVEAVNEELLEALFNLKQFCPHFHLSLQSGCDKVLSAMNRKYTTNDYLDRIELIRSYDANASITTDIIVGYPTETDEQFCETLEFVKKVRFSDIHVFPFSSRKGTVASKLPIIAKEIVMARRDKLIEEKHQLHSEYLEKNIGVVQKVLFEEVDGDNKVGYSDRYIRIYANCDSDYSEIMPVALYKDGLKGE